MKLGLWFLPAVAIAAAETLLAAALPVPPSLPSSRTAVEPASPTSVAAAPAAVPPAPTPMQAAPAPVAAAATPLLQAPLVPPAPALARHGSVTAAVTIVPGAGPKHSARKPARHLAKAAPDRHRRAVAQVVGPRYGAIVPAPPPGPYPGMPPRPPTQIALAPPPYGMPAPYWHAPYPPY